jgi:hypothetical protein
VAGQHLGALATLPGYAYQRDANLCSSSRRQLPLVWQSNSSRRWSARYATSVSSVARRGRFQGPAAVLAADDRKEYHVATNFEAAHRSSPLRALRGWRPCGQDAPGNGCRAGLMVACCCSTPGGAVWRRRSRRLLRRGWSSPSTSRRAAAARPEHECPSTTSGHSLRRANARVSLVDGVVKSFSLSDQRLIRATRATRPQLPSPTSVNGPNLSGRDCRGAVTRDFPVSVLRRGPSMVWADGPDHVAVLEPSRDARHALAPWPVP